MSPVNEAPLVVGVWLSRWTQVLPSLSMSTGTPLSTWVLPRAGEVIWIDFTSLVLTKPPAVESSLKVTALPLMMVGAPPPDCVPLEVLPLQLVPAVPVTKGAAASFPLPNQTPAVRQLVPSPPSEVHRWASAATPPQELGWPPLQRSTSLPVFSLA